MKISVKERTFLDSLKAKRKGYFVGGTMTSPSRDFPDYADRATINTLTISWIFLMLDSSLFLYAPYKYNAKALWDI